MKQDDVHDYLVRGIYGDKELKPEEKKRFLGEFRERVIIALTQEQVRRKEPYAQITRLMIKNSDSTLLLNGEMEYEALSKYIKLSNQYKVPYRKYYDNTHDTDIGLVLASPVAVDIEHIFIDDKTHTDIHDPEGHQDNNEKSSRVFHKLTSLFHRKS